MRLPRIFASLLAAAVIAVAVPSPAFADEPLKVEFLTPFTPKATYVVVDMRVTNLINSEVTFYYYRPGGAESRHIVLKAANDRRHDATEDVHMPCGQTSQLVFVYEIEGGSKGQFTKDVATPACAQASKAPTTQPPKASPKPSSPQTGDQGGDDRGFLGDVWHWTKIVLWVIAGLVLLVAFIWIRGKWKNRR